MPFLNSARIKSKDLISFKHFAIMFNKLLIKSLLQQINKNYTIRFLRLCENRYLSKKNMFRLFAITSLLLTTFYCSAQIKATTDDGRIVTLYKNGTWTYSDTVKTDTIGSIIDETKELQSEYAVLCYEESRQLSKFFNGQKSLIRCQCAFVISKGHIIIQFQWETPVSAGYKYFGHLFEGQIFTFIDANNNRTDIQLNKEVSFIPSEKYEFSVLKGSAFLSAEQVQHLLAAPISKIEVNWKKETETYSLIDTEFFKKNLKPLINK